MAIDLNFGSEMESSEPITEGDHTFIVEDVDLKDNKAGTGQNLVVTATVSGGEDDGKNNTLYLPLLPQSLWKVKIFMEAVSGETLPEEDISIEEDALIGKTFIGTVEHTESGDRTYANIVAFS